MTALPLRSANKQITNQRPTMRDVARLAGDVHPSTVSLALRNHPGISEATRKRVRLAARKLGYRPDPLLDAFNTHRLEVLPHKAPPVIAFVADFESRAALEKARVHGEIWAGARAMAESLHCQIELFLLHRSQLTPERLHSILRARGIASLIIGACRPSTTRLAFEWPDYSAVKIESTQITAPLYGVCVDQRQAARLAVRSLRELGYRRIGLATTPATQPRQDDFARAGFLLEQRRNPEGFFAPMIELSEDDRSDVMPKWIQKNRLDAVICDQSEMIQVLGAHQLNVPEDVAFAGLNVAATQGEVAGIVADHTRVGGQAVEQVVSLLRTNQRGLPATASCTYVPVHWHAGASAPARTES